MDSTEPTVSVTATEAGGLDTDLADAPRRTWLAGMQIAYDRTVLTPRPWTIGQGHWAAELAEHLPPGPMLELCAGVGHIGLAAAMRTDRALVQVDASPRACHFAESNALAAGLHDRVEVRCAPIETALGPDEMFPLVLADPPYVPTAEVAQYPDDPVLAIDGGEDGFAVVHLVLDMVARALLPEGRALLQLRGEHQAELAGALLPEGLSSLATRHFGPGCSVVLLGRAAAPTAASPGAGSVAGSCAERGTSPVGVSATEA